MPPATRRGGRTRRSAAPPPKVKSESETTDDEEEKIPIKSSTMKAKESTAPAEESKENQVPKNAPRSVAVPSPAMQTTSSIPPSSPQSTAMNLISTLIRQLQQQQQHQQPPASQAQQMSVRSAARPISPSTVEAASILSNQSPPPLFAATPHPHTMSTQEFAQLVDHIERLKELIQQQHHHQPQIKQGMIGKLDQIMERIVRSQQAPSYIVHRVPSPPESGVGTCVDMRKPGRKRFASEEEEGLFEVASPYKMARMGPRGAMFSAAQQRQRDFEAELPMRMSMTAPGVPTPSSSRAPSPVRKGRMGRPRKDAVLDPNAPVSKFPMAVPKPAKPLVKRRIRVKHPELCRLIFDVSEERAMQRFPMTKSDFQSIFKMLDGDNLDEEHARLKAKIDAGDDAVVNRWLHKYKIRCSSRFTPLNLDKFVSDYMHKEPYRSLTVLDAEEEEQQMLDILDGPRPKEQSIAIQQPDIKMEEPVKAAADPQETAPPPQDAPETDPAPQPTAPAIKLPEHVKFHPKLYGGHVSSTPSTSRILYQDKNSIVRNHLTQIKSLNPNICHWHFELSYQKMSEEHIVVLRSLLNQTAFPNYTVKDILSDLSYSIVALYGHLPVGYISIDHSHQQPTTAYMHILWVHPHFRRLGIAKRLLFLALKKYEGKRDVLLHVDCGNSEAMCLYQMFGFKSEAFLLGFYEGESHLLPSSSRNGNAFYMRLRK